jgi:hypothetical protein
MRQMMVNMVIYADPDRRNHSHYLARPLAETEIKEFVHCLEGWAELVGTKLFPFRRLNR